MTKQKKNSRGNSVISTEKFQSVDKQVYLEIEIRHPRIRITLKKEARILAKKEWEDQNSLSQRLLVEIDKMLQAHHLLSSQLKAIKVKTNKKSYSSARIAQAVALAKKL